MHPLTSLHSNAIISLYFFPFSALCLAVGMIFYISAVNDEVSHRKKPPSGAPKGEVFHYHYGWAFFFAGGSFICSMMAVVSNITLYVKRYPNLEDMVLIIPGLEKRGGFDVNSRSGEFMEASECGTQNPTIIL